MNDFSPEEVEVAFKSFLEKNEIGIGAVLPQLRLLLSGKGMGPSVFEIASFLGKEETLARIKVGMSALAVTSI